MDDKMSQKSSVFHSAYSTLSRPTTAAVLKMLHKIRPLYSRKESKRSSATDVQKVIERLTKLQKKASASHAILIESLNSWASDFNNDETALVIQEFITLLDTVDMVFATRTENYSKLKVQMGAIAIRETRQNDLISKHAKLQKAKEANSMKLGPNASKTLLVIDEIEENEYNLKLIEQQLLRTTSANMREACRGFILWLLECIDQLGKQGNAFNALFCATDPIVSARRIGLSLSPSILRQPPSTFDTPEDSGGISLIDERRAALETGRTSVGKNSQKSFESDRTSRRHDDRYESLLNRHTEKSQQEVSNEYDIRKFQMNHEGWK